eukprot:4292783-Pleurochrysis_carterae.AAC.3
MRARAQLLASSGRVREGVSVQAQRIRQRSGCPARAWLMRAMSWRAPALGESSAPPPSRSCEGSPGGSCACRRRGGRC